MTAQPLRPADIPPDWNFAKDQDTDWSGNREISSAPRKFNDSLCYCPTSLTLTTHVESSRSATPPVYLPENLAPFATRSRFHSNLGHFPPFSHESGPHRVGPFPFNDALPPLLPLLLCLALLILPWALLLRRVRAEERSACPSRDAAAVIIDQVRLRKPIAIPEISYRRRPRKRIVNLPPPPLLAARQRKKRRRMHSRNQHRSRRNRDTSRNPTHTTYPQSPYPPRQPTAPQHEPTQENAAQPAQGIAVQPDQEIAMQAPSIPFTPTPDRAADEAAQPENEPVPHTTADTPAAPPTGEAAATTPAKPAKKKHGLTLLQRILKLISPRGNYFISGPVNVYCNSPVLSRKAQRLPLEAPTTPLATKKYTPELIKPARGTPPSRKMDGSGRNSSPPNPQTSHAPESAARGTLEKPSTPMPRPACLKRHVATTSPPRRKPLPISRSQQS